jgi:hypothetical protein
MSSLIGRICGSFVFLGAVGVLSMSVLTPTASALEGTVTGNLFESKDHGIAFGIPDGWALDPETDPSMEAMIKSPPSGPDDEFSENVNLIVTPLPPAEDAMTVAQLADIVVKVIPQQYPGTIVGKPEACQVGGQEAVKVSYDLEMAVEGQSLKVHTTQWFVKGAGKAYIFTYTAKQAGDDALAKQAQSLIDSVKFAS